MANFYEYKFVRLEEHKVWLTGTPTPDQSAREGYQEVVRQYAREGWRLVQIFAPGIGASGAAGYYELILERELTAWQAAQQ